MSSPASTAEHPPKFKRSARNYLLDAPFQLKYTGYIVALTLCVSVALGFLLYRQSTKTVHIGSEAVSVGNEAVKIGQDAVDVGNSATAAGKEAVQESENVNMMLSMNSGLIPSGCTGDDTMTACSQKLYANNPSLEEMLKSSTDTTQKEVEERASKLEAAATNLGQKADLIAQKQKQVTEQHDALEAQSKTLLFTVTGALALLVLLVGLAGIFFTHKIVGPIYKMKRLLREVGDGKLTVSGSLRKGDELHDFFLVFEHMVEKLRTRQKAEIERLDAAIEMAQKSGADEASIMKLQTLRTDMQHALDT